MLSPDELRALWTEPRTPQYHAGVGDSVFKTFHIFDRAMTARMGAPTSLADYVRKAQVMAYENERAMFEAFSRNRYGATGLIQWMLNNAWPSLHWNLFDWYLEPNGSTFGAKTANEPLHVQYSYDDRSVAVVNQTSDDASGLTAEARVFDLRGDERWHRSAPSTWRPTASRISSACRQPANITSTYFVELTLSDASGDVVSRNVYWLVDRGGATGVARVDVVLHAHEDVRGLHGARRPADGPPDGLGVRGRRRTERARSGSR